MYTLDELVRIEDALWCMGRGWSYEEYLVSIKYQYQRQYTEAWESANMLVFAHGTLAKAREFVKREMINS